MQPSSESVNKMKERFFASLFNEDSKYNSVLMTKQKYDSTIEDVKRIKISNKKESSRDYRIVQRYDVMTVEGCEILTEPLSDERESVKKFVHAEELFDILYTTHLSIGHGGRDRMIKQLNSLYKNITQAQIKMFLDLCEFCQQKSVKKGTNASINMVEDNGFDLNGLCRICSSDLQDKGVGIFSAECMDNLVGEKIRRYLYFSVSIKDNLPKMVCTTCLKKLENIHRFAKMAAEMQEKFRMLLATKQEKPKIKIKSLDDINKEASKETESSIESSNAEESGKTKPGKADVDENLEMNLDVAVEEVGDNSEDVKIEETNTGSEDCQNAKKKEKKNSSVFNGVSESKGSRAPSVEDENEADTSDSDRLVIQDEEKPNPSLLHCLLLKGKQQMSTDIDHDYLMKVKEEPEIKEEPADPEDEDIAEEIAEDRLNQIIKDEMDSESDQDSEPDENSDLEITEMEVKVDPTLYFSNASQSGNEIEQDSQDGQDSLMADGSFSNNSNGSPAPPESERKSNEKKDTSSDRPLVMTRLQQKMNPVIASLKLGKPYKCTLCPRSFITDIGLQNHLWSHLPKSRKSQANGGTMIPKNIDLEDSQVYSSNGVLHTALPSENPHLLKYVCPICGKKISTKGNLKVHLETHRPKGKYGCDICGRVFKTAANLFRHKDYHGGVQFPCPVCGRVYPTNSTLRAHSITHSDLRPHKCPLCSKTFKRNQDLKFHINQHTGARPYQCPYCPKAFASSGNCFSHRKRMHPLEVERDKERAAEIMG